MTDAPTILFAGGGSGGHIFPNVAVIERLRQRKAGCRPRLLVSQRPIDRQIVDDLGLDAVALPAKPLAMHPLRLPGAAVAYLQSKAQVGRLIREQGAAAVVGSGGFVSGPAIAAGAGAGVPTAMINLDAVPGRANRAMARKASRLFAAHESPALPHALRIGVPLRPSVLRQTEPGEARRQMGLDPGRPTLLVTAGSQGARSINRLMLALCDDSAWRAALAGWQVIHQSGAHDSDELARAYEDVGVLARVTAFISDMGLAWSASDAAISRAGAGSAAEVWARAVPTLFLPYPHHRDQHQAHNARPLVDAGGAVLLTDHDDPQATLADAQDPLGQLLGDPARRTAMRSALQTSTPPDGADAVTAWLIETLALSTSP